MASAGCRSPAKRRSARWPIRRVGCRCGSAADSPSSGGPAGIMLGFLLARADVRTVVLERHKDFFRDFRGDTIHPSTLQIMHELGLLEAFLRLPHQKVQSLQ